MPSPPQSGHAQIYLDQGRYGEAAKLLREQLASAPDDVVTLLQLATCYYQDDGDPKNTARGLELIGSALRLAPEFAPAHGLHARLLADAKKYDAALGAARRAIALEPGDPDGHGAEAVVHAKRQHWKEAEAAARQGLRADPEDNPCSAVLAHALLMQGKTAEHQEEVRYRMSRDPEDPYTHFNMGLAALRAGNHRDAEKHLGEALRLQPDFEPARQLLLEAFRARSPLYRGFQKFEFAMANFKPGTRVGIILGMYAAYQVSRTMLEESAPKIALILAALWVTFAVFSFIKEGLGNLIISMDRSARLALNRTEQVEGFAVGLPVVTGLLLIAAAFVIPGRELVVIGGCLIGPTVPLSVWFKSENENAKKFYGALAALTLLCAILTAAGTLSTGLTAIPGWVGLPMLVGIVIAAGTTWLAGFGFLRD